MMIVNEIEKQAKGEITINYLGGPEVMRGLDQGIAVKNGVIDMSFLPSAYYEGLVPIGDMLLLSEVSVAEERERGAWDVLRDIHEESGLYFLGRGKPLNDTQFLMTLKERVDTPYDLAGRKIGGSSVHIEAFADALGMSFTIIPLPEAYTAMERGVVEVYSTPYDTTVGFSIHEASNYAIDHLYFVDNTVVIMNLDTWNGLSQHLKDVIWNSYLAAEPAGVDAYIAMKADQRKKMEEVGIEWIKFSPADAEWFLKTGIDAEWEKQLKKTPDIASRLKGVFSK